MDRKIASNYIFLPGYPLTRNGYVVLAGGRVKEVIDTGGVIREIQGLEFYGGMIVAGYVGQEDLRFKVGEGLLPVLECLYAGRGMDYQSLAIVEGADLVRFEIRASTSVRLLAK